MLFARTWRSWNGIRSVVVVSSAGTMRSGVSCPTPSLRVSPHLSGRRHARSRILAQVSIVAHARRIHGCADLERGATGGDDAGGHPRAPDTREPDVAFRPSGGDMDGGA